MKDWPVKLQLTPLKGLEGQPVLLAADCAAALCRNLERHTKGKRLLLACPKLESKEDITDRLARLLTEAAPASLEIMRMEVPCCCLPDLVRQAVERCASSVPVSTSVISIHGREPLALRLRP